MANSTVAEIQVSQGAIAGAIFWAPKTATVTLPTDATATLDTDFQNLGYIGEDGITPAREVSTEDVKDMNGANLRTVQTDFSKSYAAPMLQVRNVYLNNAIFGEANVTETPADGTHGKRIEVHDQGRVADRGYLVIETYDGTARDRRVIAEAQITAVEEGPLVGTAVQQFTLTYSAYPDSNGDYEVRYSDDGLVDAG